MKSRLLLLKAFIFIISFFLFSESIAQKKTTYKAIEAQANEYFRVEEYAQALPLFIQLDSLKPHNPAVLAKIGISYLHTEFKYKALPYLEEAVSKGYQKDFIDYFIARAYHLDHQFDKAINYYQISKAQQNPKNQEDLNRIARINRYMEMCASGKELIKAPIDVKIENLGDKLNSPYADYAPVISADETVLIFTSRRPSTTGGLKDEHGQYYEDIYMSVKEENGEWSKPQNLGSPINTGGHDASIGLSPDGQELLIYKHDGAGDIFYSNLNANSWSLPKRMPGNVNTPKSWEPSASITSDEKILFFASDREGGFGGRDIYVTKKLPNETWALPKNLGPSINTSSDEDAPFIHADGTTLYFSSKGHNSMGGFDIFTVQYNPQNDSVSQVANLGYPINTADDDIYFVWSADGTRGYFSSIRTTNNFGEKDIYLLTRPKPHVALIVLKGKIFSKANQRPIAATLTVTDNETNKVVGVYSSNSFSGKYTVIVPPGRNYGIAVEASDHLFYSENIFIPNKDEYFEVTKDIFLEPLERGSITVLKNVFFDFGSTDLRKESGIELDKFHKILSDNPTLQVEVAGHTDNVGNEVMNLELSQKRSISVTKYLINKGIDPKRLCAIGYGEKYNVASNNTEEGRQQNRRTEIIILGESSQSKKIDCKGFYTTNKDVPLVKNQKADTSAKATNENLGKVNTSPTEKSVNSLPHIYFEYNSFVLASRFKKNLDLWGKFLQDNPSIKIEVGGHTDGRGSEDYNKVLAEKRVTSVREYLISTGISPERISAVSYGKTRPIASNETEEGRKKNRRVEITIFR